MTDGIGGCTEDQIWRDLNILVITYVLLARKSPMPVGISFLDSEEKRVHNFIERLICDKYNTATNGATRFRC